MQVNFFNTIHATLKRNKNNTLIIWPSGDNTAKNFSGSDLLGKIAAIRGLLPEKKSSDAENILLALPVSIDLICSLLAIQSLGNAPVLPFANAKAGDLLKLIKRHRVKSVVMANKPDFFLKTIAFFYGFKIISVRGYQITNIIFPVTNVAPQQAALITHSSGSTGKAKPVFRSHKVLLAQHQVLKEIFPPWPQQRDFPLFPNILLHNLAIDVVSILPDIPNFKLRELQPTKIIEQLTKEKVETLTGNVYYFTKIIDHLTQYPFKFPNIKAVGIGGSPVPEKLVVALKTYFTNASIYIIYGSSEAEPIAVRKIDSELIDPLHGYNVGIINNHLELSFSIMGEVKAGTKLYPVGEIVISGDHVANVNNQGLHTGDFGYLNENNQLLLTARKGNEKICNGFQHYQLEHLLLNNKAVENVAAIIGNDGIDFYVQSNLDEKEIIDILISHLPKEKIKSINKRDKLPVDERHHSKILYNQIK